MERKNGKKYPRYRLTMTKKEGIRVSQAGIDWDIFDVDPKGELILQSHKRLEYHRSGPKPHHNTSFRLHLDPYEWQRFREMVRSRGSSVCEVFSAFVRGVLTDGDSLLDRRVTLVFNYQGWPRGKRRSLISSTPSGVSGPISSQT